MPQPRDTNKTQIVPTHHQKQKGVTKTRSKFVCVRKSPEVLHEKTPESNYQFFVLKSKICHTPVTQLQPKTIQFIIIIHQHSS